jgi:hypothetical protein
MKRSRHLALSALVAVVAFGAGAVRPGHAQGVPLAPGAVQAYPGPGGAVFVTWLAVPNSPSGYNVYRRAADAAADQAVLVNPEPLATTWLLDPGQPVGKPVRYFVRAVYKDASGNPVVGPPTGDAAVTPQTGIQAPGVPQGSLFYYDIATAFPGSATVDGDVLTIRGSGQDVWAGDDGHTFLATPVAGDYQITLRLNEAPTEGHVEDGFAKVGPQIKESLAPGSRDAFVYSSVQRDPQVIYQARKRVGGGDDVYFPGTSLDETTYPLYLRLVKQGATITAFQSFDNTTYTQVGDPVEFGSLPPVTYVGLAATAHKEGTYVIGKVSLSSIKIEPK